MFALDVSQINWRTTVAHLPTEDTHVPRCVAEFSRIRSRRRLAAPLARRQRRALPWEARPPHAGPHSPEPLCLAFRQDRPLRPCQDAQKPIGQYAVRHVSVR
jgi:hypothetical protein